MNRNFVAREIVVDEEAAAGVRRQSNAKDLLTKVGLANRGDHYPSELSSGQQQRVAIARALAIRPKLMLFDEPTSALDPELRHEVLQVMRQLTDEGMTMVVVTHEIGFARDVGSRLLFMDQGTILHDGDPKGLLSEPPSERFANFLQHIRQHQRQNRTKKRSSTLGGPGDGVDPIGRLHVL
jgi:glutamine transport system ATP-binding protein